MWNLKNLTAGTLFALASLYCVISIARGSLGKGMYTLTGAGVFAVVAIAFFKRARH